MPTRRLAAWIVTTLLVLAAAGRPVRAEPVLALGSLERESVDEALEELGLTLDPTPEGKRIGRIHVVTHDVFSRRDGKFQFLNHFHRTTRARAIERELLLRPGELWDDSLADESVRNLQAMAPLFFSDGTLFGAPEITGIVVIVPIQSAIPGGVDLLVVTRDVWSLRTNTEFAFQKDTLSMLRLSLSENNLMGWRKQLAASFDMDLGRYGVGPTYFDPNVLGTRMTLLARGTVWYARDTGRREGDTEVFSLRLPLYALARTWGAALDVSHQDAVVRSFCDHILCPVDVAGTSVPLTYRLRTLSADGNVVRSFGKSIVQRLTAGYRVFRTRALVDDDFPADPAVADAFLDEWAPVRETRSEPYLRYELFTARYGFFRGLDTFDLREFRRLGPLLSLEIGVGVPVLGADRLAYPFNATASWGAAPGGSGFAVAQAQVSARASGGELIDQRLSGILYFASPIFGRAVRVVVAGVSDVVRADSYRTHFFMGGDTGLRGYQIGEFQGTVQAAFHAEVRSAALPLLSQRVGALLFYDVGDAASSYRGLSPHNDFGIGLRWLIPQLNSSVVRIDWAIAADYGPYTRPGLPGRITAGFMQSFWLLDSYRGYRPTY